ncbi:hypothetical protein D922_04458 [Enterococcus faecalis 06-MB-DW-09]|nr:hypothetical protein D922_04458 [Enterococcus faecalis 06-MB-DW-09]
MMKSVKDTIGVWLLLLVIVAVSAIHAALGVVLITSWAIIDLAWYAGIAEGKRRTVGTRDQEEGA